jgi:hypothetical protein
MRIDANSVAASRSRAESCAHAVEWGDRALRYAVRELTTIVDAGTKNAAAGGRARERWLRPRGQAGRELGCHRWGGGGWECRRRNPARKVSGLPLVRRLERLGRTQECSTGGRLTTLPISRYVYSADTDRSSTSSRGGTSLSTRYFRYAARPSRGESGPFREPFEGNRLNHGLDDVRGQRACHPLVHVFALWHARTALERCRAVDG